MKTFANILLLIIIILALLGWFTGCSPTLTKQQKLENKVAKKLQKIEDKNPEAYKNVTTEIVRIDTLIPEVRIVKELRIDTLETEKLVKEYIRDTVLVTRFIKEFLRTTRDSVAVDTLGIHLRLSGTNIDFDLKRDPIHIVKEQEVRTVTITETTVLKRRFYRDWQFWVFIAIAAALYTFRKIIVAYIKGITGRF